MITDAKIEEAFEKVWNELKEEISKPRNCSLEKGASIIFSAGYLAAMEEMKKEGTFERLPCDCHLFKEQVCDHCQEVLIGFRKTLRDKEGRG